MPEGRLLAHDEQLIAHFQRWVREQLGGGWLSGAARVR